MAQPGVCLACGEGVPEGGNAPPYPGHSPGCALVRDWLTEGRVAAAFRAGAVAMREAVAARVARHAEFYGQPDNAPTLRDVVLSVPVPDAP